MAQTVSGLTILQLFLQRSGIGEYIPNADVGSLAASALTSVKWFRNANHPTNHYRSKGAMIWRPGNATGVADDIRAAGDLTASTGVLAPDAAWSDTTLGTEDFYLLYHELRYSWIIDAMNLALRDVYFVNEEPLSLAADAGFQSTATSSYTEADADGGPATTFTKITTADSFNVFPSFVASGRILNAAANGYIRQRFTVTRGEEVYVGWLVRADVGTASLTLYDITNSVELGTAITTTEENWQYLWRRESVTSGASGTETLEVRLQGVGASDDLYNNALWVYRTQSLTLPLSTTWDTSFKVPALSYLTFRQNTASNVEAAFSMDKREIPREDYDFLISRPGANPYAIQFHTDRWFQYPILIEGRRAHADVDGPFTRVLTETTSCDRDLFEAAMRRRFFLDERVQVPNKERRLVDAERDFKEYSRQFVDETPQDKQVRIYYPRIR